MAATVVGTGGASIPADPPMDRRRLIAFFAMVFGMFMSILDIQIVSASLAEIQAGLGAGSDEIAWVHNLVGKTGVHSQGTLLQTTGFNRPGFPSAGCWVRLNGYVK